MDSNRTYLKNCGVILKRIEEGLQVSNQIVEVYQPVSRI